jgi:hypothetical protein
MLIIAPVVPAAAQEPTPTPQVLRGQSGQTFVIEQKITYGETGIMLALLFLAGVNLMSIFQRIGEWLIKERF